CRRVDPSRKVDRQSLNTHKGAVGPMSEFLPEIIRPRVFAQTFRPVLKRCRLGNMVYVLAAAQERIAFKEISHQDSPANGINNEVMNDNQQATGPVRSKIKENEPRNGAFGKVEASLN